MSLAILLLACLPISAQTLERRYAALETRIEATADPAQLRVLLAEQERIAAELERREVERVQAVSDALARGVK